MKKALKLFLILGVVAAIAFTLTRTCKPSGEKEIVAKADYVQDTSTIFLPIQIDIASFESVFNKQMDEQGWFFEENDIEVNKNLSISFRVKKEGFAQLFPQDNKIQLRIPLFIEIDPEASGPLRLAVGKNLKLQAKVMLNSAVDADIDANWDLLADAETTFDIEESPTLNIAGFEISFKDQLANNLDVGVEEINTQIEKQVIDAINTREIIELIWEEIKTPYHIEEEPFDSWAMIKPTSAAASDLKPGGPGMMETTFLVNALIDIKTGKRPIRVNTKKIPNAKRLESFEKQYTQLRIPLYIPFNTFTTYLNDLEEPLSFNIQGNRTITLSNLSGKQTEDLLIVSADFATGKTSGILELTGIPTFNPEKQTLGVSIQDISTKSNNKIVDQLVATLQKNSSFKRSIERKMNYSLEQDLADLTFDITSQIKATQFHDYARLDGYINQIKIEGIHMVEEQFLLDTNAEVSLTCIVSAGNQSSVGENDWKTELSR